MAEPIKMTKELLWKKYQEAIKGLCSHSGIWTVEHSACEVSAGIVDVDRRFPAEVKIEIQCDPNDWTDSDAAEEYIDEYNEDHSNSDDDDDEY